MHNTRGRFLQCNEVALQIFKAWWVGSARLPPAKHRRRQQTLVVWDGHDVCGRGDFIITLTGLRNASGAGKTSLLSVVSLLELGHLSSPALGHRCSRLLGLQTRLQLTPPASRFPGPLIWTELPHPLFWASGL